MLKICCGGRTLIMLSVLLVSSTAHSAEMLFTSLTCMEARPIGASTYVSIDITGSGVSEAGGTQWDVLIAPESDGQTYIGDRQVLGDALYYNFNKGLTNGASDNALWITFYSFGGGGTGFGKPGMFEDISIPAIGYSVDSNFTPPNGLDMEGSHLTKFELDINNLSFSNGVVTASFTLRIYGDDGQIPEPASAALFVLGLCLLLSHHTPHWRR